jgi:hypothetical protein
MFWSAGCVTWNACAAALGCVAMGMSLAIAPLSAQVGNNSSERSKTRREAVVAKRRSPARLKPFFDISFHSRSATSSAEESDYQVDGRFWERRPTLVVVTPITLDALQPEETFAEATTEALLRQIATDLDIRSVNDQVSQTIGLLRKLRNRSKRSADSGTARAESQPTPRSGETPQDESSLDSAPTDARGLKSVQLILLADTRPLWTGMSLFDRRAVAERSLSEYLKKAPEKREKLVQYLDEDLFRFSAFLDKDSSIQLMGSLGIGRPGFHVLIADRRGEVVGKWSKSEFNAPEISRAYIRACEENHRPVR